MPETDLPQFSDDEPQRLESRANPARSSALLFAREAFYLSDSITYDQKRILRKRILEHGGKVVPTVEEATTVIVHPDRVQRTRTKFGASANQKMRETWIEPPTFIDKCIRKRKVEHDTGVAKRMGIDRVHTDEKIRVAFTEGDKERLAYYIAARVPNAEDGGRSGNKIYKDLVDLSNEEEYAWAQRHTWSSWREYYVRRKKEMDRLIDAAISKFPPPSTQNGIYPYKRTQQRSRREEEESTGDEVDELQENENENNDEGEEQGEESDVEDDRGSDGGKRHVDEDFSDEAPLRAARATHHEAQVGKRRRKSQEDSTSQKQTESPPRPPAVAPATKQTQARPKPRPMPPNPRVTRSMREPHPETGPSKPPSVRGIKAARVRPSGQGDSASATVPPISEASQDVAGGETMDIRTVVDTLFESQARASDESMDSDDKQTMDDLDLPPDEFEAHSDDSSDDDGVPERLIPHNRAASRKEDVAPAKPASTRSAAAKGKGKATPPSAKPIDAAAVWALRSRAERSISTEFPSPGTRAREERDKAEKAQKEAEYVAPQGTRAAKARK